MLIAVLFIFKAELGSLQGYFLVSANKERKYYYSSFFIYIYGEKDVIFILSSFDGN